MKKAYLSIWGTVILAFFLLAAVATTMEDYFMPGSQPGESGNFDHPDKCASCHGGYDAAVEPTFNWQGSMMAHSMRDPLFLASMTIANQDAQFSGDLCIRCHSPSGWLSGRSEPTDGSALLAEDREGVSCHFCHKMIDPQSTDPDDLAYLNTLEVIPPQSGNGMYVADDNNNTKRGPYVDANAKHPVIYSSFHVESDLCATCHDVSNPVFSKAPDGTYQPNTIGERAPSFNTYDLFPVERTYSEWKMSAYNSPNGVPSDVFGGNKANVSSCQDCHMKDVTGYGCNKNGVPLRTDLGLHDLTGGNTFIPGLVAQLYPDEVNAAAIEAGVQRAEGMLKNAATMNLSVEPLASEYQATVEIINETGHKLPSGYPEGRRMWIQLMAYDASDNLIFTSGAYNTQTAELEKDGTKIYEAKLGMSQEVADAASAGGQKTYQAGESFHFVLNNQVIKDNRIPPRGFTNANFEAIQAAPVAYAYEDGAYSDETTYSLPLQTRRVVARLLYQTVSKEYIEFLRDENRTDDKGQLMYDLWAVNGKSAPVVMNEVEFLTDALSVDDLGQIRSGELRLYPNPAENRIQVEWDSATDQGLSLELYTLNGALLRSSKKESQLNFGQNAEWDLGDLPAGTYILKIDNGIKIVSRKLIIR